MGICISLIGYGSQLSCSHNFTILTIFALTCQMVC
jgi:hypothetical protein